MSPAQIQVFVLYSVTLNVRSAHSFLKMQEDP